jgi:hypothetical protein
MLEDAGVGTAWHMVGRQLLAAGGGVRRAVVWALPSWRTVRGLTWRLFALGLLLAGFGLQSIAGLAAAGPAAAGSLHPGYAAIGLTCLLLSVALPAAYLAVAVATATGSLLGRRAVAMGRAVATVGRQRAGPRRRGRPR